MLHKNSKKALHTRSAPNKPQIKSRNKIIGQNHSFDQGKAFWKLLKFRTWFCLLCTLHLNMLCCSTCEVYFGYFKKLSEN